MIPEWRPVTFGMIAGLALGLILSQTILVYWKNKGDSKKKEPSDQDKSDNEIHKHCNMRIYAERAGRIAAERTIRNEVVKKISDVNVGFPTLVIGNVQSPFVGKRGTPRQGLLVSETRGVIQLRPEIPIESLEGLEDYSHIFLFFIFHQNTNLPKVLLRSLFDAQGVLSTPGSPQNPSIDQQNPLAGRSESIRVSGFNKKVPLFAGKVFPPLLKGGNTGVFATRSPHHPNPFGQSLVKVLAVDKRNRRIHIAGLDLCDGTPVIDLKPWNPADCPTCLHSIVNHKRPPTYTCDLDCAPAQKEDFSMRIPGWVAAGIQDPYELDVKFQPSALESLQKIVKESKLDHYKAENMEQLELALRKILSLDIRSFHQGRGKRNVTVDANSMAEDSQNYQDWELDYDKLNIKFVVRDNGPQADPFVSIESVALR